MGVSFSPARGRGFWAPVSATQNPLWEWHSGRVFLRVLACGRQSASPPGKTLLKNAESHPLR